jgi:hypothetical protein
VGRNSRTTPAINQDSRAVTATIKPLKLPAASNTTGAFLGKGEVAENVRYLEQGH